MAGFIGVYLVKFDVDHIRVLVMAMGRAAHVEFFHMYAGAQKFEHGLAKGWHKQGKTNRIGEKPRGEEQGPGEQNHGTMGQVFGRVIEPGEGIAQIAHRHQALRAHQPGADDGGHNHDAQCRPQANGTADLNEQGNFNQRDGEKGQQQPHAYDPFHLLRKVDLIAPTPYIRGNTHSFHAPHEIEVHMNSPLIQLLVLLGIAVFLIIRLKSVLGTRDGFEAPPAPQPGPTPTRRRGFEVIDGGPDRDITDHIGEDTEAAGALAEMKRIEPAFSLTQFLQGAKGAYEMILMAFERGRMDEITPFLGKDVFEAFSQVVDDREAQGLSVEADFVGVSETALLDARFDPASKRAEIDVKFVGELISVVRNKNGEIVEGAADQAKRQKDIWTFERIMGSGDPNWRLVATGE